MTSSMLAFVLSIISLAAAALSCYAAKIWDNPLMGIVAALAAAAFLFFGSIAIIKAH